MHRILLEAYQYSDNCFATLTYRNENLRTSSGELITSENDLPSLQPIHHTNFLKRLRKVMEPTRIRFYGVGEYGDDTFRPHYHYALFNMPTCLRGRTLRRPGSNEPRWEQCCEVCRTVGEAWTFGNVDLGILEEHSAQYLAGYVVKKMTAKDDLRLEGRKPEFARMSNRPGLGYDALHEIASEMMKFNLDDTQVDVPSSLRHGKKLLPLGRYLTGKLRELIGKDGTTPQEVISRMEKELFELRLAAAKDADDPSFKSHLLKANKGKIASFEARERIYRQRKHL